MCKILQTSSKVVGIFLEGLYHRETFKDRDDMQSNFLSKPSEVPIWALYLSFSKSKHYQLVADNITIHDKNQGSAEARVWENC